MFLDFYHMREQPFGVTPDPRFLYLSQTHREALASLYYGVETGRGFLALIAQPGMGKTTLLLHLLERFRKSGCTAFVFQTQCDSREFISYLLADMGIESRGHDLVQMREQLNDALIRFKREDRRFVLVIDEAQNLEDSVLETVRLLSNFETPSSKLMQIIISGQPQLAAKLARPSLAQLRQRIAVLCRLEPLSPAETDRYIADRLQMANYQGGPLFTSDALAIIAEWSRGIPRNINNLCFNALSLGYALGRKKIDGEIVREVLRDLDFESLVREGGNAPTIASPSAPSRAFGTNESLVREESEAPSIVSPGFPTELPCIFATKPQGERGSGPFRAAALVFSLGLASLLLSPYVRRPLGTQLDRVVSGSVLRLAKSLGLNHHVLSPAASTTTPPSIGPKADGAAIDPNRPTFLPNVSTIAPLDKTAGADGAANDVVPPEAPTVVIEVKPGQSLEQISIGYFGRFDLKLLGQIRGLNPQITDPDLIESGQRIVLPRRTQTSPGTDSIDLANVESTAPKRN